MATQREAMATAEMLVRLRDAGIGREDALQLRRISMTLHRWHELECGAHGAGKDSVSYSALADRERGALRRLDKIMARYPGFRSYVQTDPRGCALYILRPDDVREGEDVSCVYTRGIAVYR